MSRNRWTNPLGWRDDEERGPLVEILDQLVAGTSSWNETCTWYPEQRRWMICFSYSFPFDHSLSGDWCTWADDPEPPPPIGPGSPPPDWPTVPGEHVGMLLESVVGQTCWNQSPYDGPFYDPAIGPWGGYGAWFASGQVGDMWVEVYPVDWDVNVWLWQWDWDVIGGAKGSAQRAFIPGQFPAFLLIDDQVGDCPGAQLQLSVYGLP